MIQLAKQVGLLEHPNIHLMCEHSEDKILVFERAGLIFAFNFNPMQSYSDYHIPVKAGRYRMILESDTEKFGGHGRLVPDQDHITLTNTSRSTERSFLSLYLPNRTAIALRRI